MFYLEQAKSRATLVESPKIYMGADPEAFVVNDKDEIVGSELVIPDDPISTGQGKIIRDGVQIEFNPSPGRCREDMGYFLGRLLTAAAAAANAKGFRISLRQADDITPENLAELSPEVRRFGCDKSFNTYFEDSPAGSLDGDIYLRRACGGHIHVSPTRTIFASVKAGDYVDVDKRTRLVPIFDVLVGNTCVLIDRDEHQVERRKYYGRAGEYRLPKYGIEYRTLSNFWLRNYVLMSMTFGLMREAVAILHQTLVNEFHKDGPNLEAELMSRVDLKKIIKAIQQNDADLAWENFAGVEDFLKTFVTGADGKQDISVDPNLEHANRDRLSLNAENVGKFKLFAKDVQTRGLTGVFPEDPLKHWAERSKSYNVNYYSDKGFEAFLNNNYPLKKEQ